MLRSTWRGVETWHGRDGVTLANERARQQGTQTATYTGAPVLDRTDERNGETEPRPTCPSVPAVRAIAAVNPTPVPYSITSSASASSLSGTVRPSILAVSTL